MKLKRKATQGGLKVERLKEIKEVIKNIKGYSRGEMMLIKIEDAEWLVEQAEKVKNGHLKRGE